MKKKYLLLFIAVLLPSCSTNLNNSSSPSSSPSISPSVVDPSISPSVVDPSIAPISENPSISPSIDTPSSEVISSEEDQPSATPSSYVTSEGTIEDIVDSGVDYSNLAIQDSPIFHAWDWKVDTVKSNLENIYNAGFRAIQLSPLHPSKSKDANDIWYQVYQPLGFKVATGDENALGTKTQLISLCNEADKYGIKIVMDVVTNHLAGDEDEFDSQVSKYESTIYNNHLMRYNGKISGADYNNGNRRMIVTGAIGLPDLKTDNSHVQSRVISMLEEYVSCGVKGFRFDAAKHIETPDDNAEYRSNFWPNIINAINNKGLEVYGETPYVYGEILDDPAISINAYTKYMSVTDNRQGTDIRNRLRNKDASGIANANYNWNDASKLVLWAESHDTYNNDGETRGFTDEQMNLTYAIQISRKDATALYYSRPYNGSDRQVVSPSSAYKSKAIYGANKLHTDFIGGSEKLSSDNGCVINVRKTNDNEGALIANLDFTNSKTVKLNGLSDGTYQDIVNNKTVTVSGGSATLSFTAGCAVLEKNTSVGSNYPTVNVVAEQATFKQNTRVNISSSNATLSYYQINKGPKVTFSGNISITVGDGFEDGEIEILVAAKNDNGGRVKSIKVKKFSLEYDIMLLDVPTNQNILAWVWKYGDNNTSKWVDLDTVGSVRGINVNNGEDMVIFARVPQGVTSKSDDVWNKVEQQTNDLRIDQGPYNYTDSSIWR